MMKELHHLDKWAYCNLDLVEEVLECEEKALIFIAGASSSGKSYSAKYLKDLLLSHGHKAVIISLDQYNVGLSAIIPNKVNINFFDGKLANLSEIKKRIKEIIYPIDFSCKYDENSLKLIRDAVSNLVPESDMDKFLNALNYEWKRLNFDESSVYDLKEASDDIKTLLNGGEIVEKKYSKVVSERMADTSKIYGVNYDCIIIEGIYALDDDLLCNFDDTSKYIKNFINGNCKTLFIRRILRDKKLTSAHNVFTISIYFNYIIKSYIETILPSKKNADLILNNNMTFEELREGDLYKTKDETSFKDEKIVDKLLADSKVLSLAYQKDVYFQAEDENNSNNVLRLRCLSDDKGKTYKPSSLVHKGVIKTRKDNKIIRAVNVFLKEGEFDQVFKSEDECVNAFLKAGFLVGPIKFKRKYKLNYRGNELTLRCITDDAYYLEFSNEMTNRDKEEVMRHFGLKW